MELLGKENEHPGDIFALATISSTPSDAWEAGEIGKTVGRANVSTNRSAVSAGEAQLQRQTCEGCSGFTEPDIAFIVLHMFV